MAKSVPIDNTPRVPDTAHVDVGRWLILGSIALAVAAGLFGVAFLSGYLTAFHAAARTLQTDHAMIVRLNGQLNAAHTELANRTASKPPAHGSWWIWWLGLPWQHLTHAT